ncbi:hypothetical protein [Geomicrobium sediminis]|uniref:EF-hand domain-containing protein n=1 Tax=Geomicrobium sediminis TaxID=1347788 RepID=A0ABS2P6I2_9BACL|nr:hypothetical protein [Geomicrobium sediminis]MBM7630956.1 hypothetical protein [Geomicrobium sediminis]
MKKFAFITSISIGFFAMIVIIWNLDLHQSTDGMEVKGQDEELESQIDEEEDRLNYLSDVHQMHHSIVRSVQAGHGLMNGYAMYGWEDENYNLENFKVSEARRVALLEEAIEHSEEEHVTKDLITILEKFNELIADLDHSEKRLIHVRELQSLYRDLDYYLLNNTYYEPRNVSSTSEQYEDERVVADEDTLIALDSQFDDGDYEEFAMFFRSYELPDEGRLSSEEAESHFSIFQGHLGWEYNEDYVFYENYLVFENESKLPVAGLNRMDPITSEMIVPYGTQGVSFVREELMRLGEAYPSPNGERHENIVPLRDEDRTYLDDIQYLVAYKNGNEDEAIQKGWGGTQLLLTHTPQLLSELELYVHEHEQLTLWFQETREYLQAADAIGYDDYEEAYTYIEAAFRNIERMNQIALND